ncbi:hypothetical protein [uncultured Eubacterium sp.]
MLQYFQFPKLLLKLRISQNAKSVTMNVYTHIGFDVAEEELKRSNAFGK